MWFQVVEVARSRTVAKLCFLLLYEQVRVRVVTFFSFVRVRAVRNKPTVGYHMICNVVFVVFWGTQLRPTAGAVVSIRKSTTLRNVH